MRQTEITRPLLRPIRPMPQVVRPQKGKSTRLLAASTPLALQVSPFPHPSLYLSALAEATTATAASIPTASIPPTTTPAAVTPAAATPTATTPAAATPTAATPTAATPTVTNHVASPSRDSDVSSPEASPSPGSSARDGDDARLRAERGQVPSAEPYRERDPSRAPDAVLSPAVGLEPSSQAAGGIAAKPSTLPGFRRERTGSNTTVARPLASSSAKRTTSEQRPAVDGARRGASPPRKRAARGAEESAPTVNAGYNGSRAASRPTSNKVSGAALPGFNAARGAASTTISVSPATAATATPAAPSPASGDAAKSNASASPTQLGRRGPRQRIIDLTTRAINQKHEGDKVVNKEEKIVCHLRSCLTYARALEQMEVRR